MHARIWTSLFAGALALSLSSVAFADHHQKGEQAGGQAADHRSDQAAEKSNAQWQEGAEKGKGASHAVDAEGEAVKQKGQQGKDKQEKVKDKSKQDKDRKKDKAKQKTDKAKQKAKQKGKGGKANAPVETVE